MSVRNPQMSYFVLAMRKHYWSIVAMAIELLQGSYVSLRGANSSGNIGTDPNAATLRSIYWLVC